MKREDLTFQRGFRVSVGNDRSQGAVMVLAKGGWEGGPDNRHKGADQWLVVISGTGAAVINDRKVPLRAGSMVLIAKTREPLGHVDPTPGIQLYSVLVLVNLEPPAVEFYLMQSFRALGRGWLENGGCRGDEAHSLHIVGPADCHSPKRSASLIVLPFHQYGRMAIIRFAGIRQRTPAGKILAAQ